MTIAVAVIAASDVTAPAGDVTAFFRLADGRTLPIATAITFPILPSVDPDRQLPLPRPRLLFPMTDTVSPPSGPFARDSIHLPTFPAPWLCPSPAVRVCVRVH